MAGFTHFRLPYAIDWCSPNEGRVTCSFNARSDGITCGISRNGELCYGAIRQILQYLERLTARVLTESASFYNPDTSSGFALYVFVPCGNEEVFHPDVSVLRTQLRLRHRRAIHP